MSVDRSDTPTGAGPGRVRVGAVYPQTELGGDPQAARRFGTAAEALGFDYLSAYDHVLGAVHADREPRLGVGVG